MSFDSVKRNRPRAAGGAVGPAGAGERNIVWDSSSDGVQPRLQAIEDELARLRTKVGAAEAMVPARPVSALPPAAPTGLVVESQTLGVAADGTHYVDVEISWDGAAPAWEIAVGRKQ